MKKNLSVAYGRFPGFTYDKLSTQKLKRKLTFCREVLDFVTILEPGISTQKALTLYELWQGEQALVTFILPKIRHLAMLVLSGTHNTFLLVNKYLQNIDPLAGDGQEVGG